MVTRFWSRRGDAFEPFGVDGCELRKLPGSYKKRKKKETNHPLGQSMAKEKKVQHVDEKDVALDLHPLVRAVFQ